jgi:hypothetical protein
MRGHTHATLCAADDGNLYVVKRQDNPISPRVLVSEWIGAQLMHRFGLKIPRVALLRGGPDDGERPSAIQFGSRYPVDPAVQAVYDYLPAALLPSVANLNMFVGAWVFDLWVCNTDVRQAVLYRNHPPAAGQTAYRSFTALFMDNSHLFGGPEWGFQQLPTANLCWAAPAYETHMNDVFAWLEKLHTVANDDTLCAIRATVPRQWLATKDAEALTRILEQLGHRQRLVPEWVNHRFRSSTKCFLNGLPFAGNSE